MNLPETRECQSVADTQALAQDFASTLKGGEAISLVGELGTGKTTFTQGVARGLGITARIISPTFVVMRSYPVPNSDLMLHHLDLYRMESAADIKALDLSELLSDPKAIILIEWPEKVAESQLPFTHRVEFTAEGDKRIITITSI